MYFSNSPYKFDICNRHGKHVIYTDDNIYNVYLSRIRKVLKYTYNKYIYLGKYDD